MMLCKLVNIIRNLPKELKTNLLHATQHKLNFVPKFCLQFRRVNGISHTLKGHLMLQLMLNKLLHNAQKLC